MVKNAISISKLTEIIKDTLENNINLSNVYVVGEISNFKLHSSGHMYFSLKDDNAKIKSVMFRGNAASLKFIPEDGMKVIVRGNISVYERDGQYQMYVYSMTPDGIGALYAAYEQLKARLELEGLFANEYKKKIPMLSTTIGIATSPTGAVIRDIINVSSNRNRNVSLLLYPVKVQGDGAADSIIDAIEYFNTRDDVDTIIIARGGGSIEELWAFNDEKLARAIFKSRLPVISAVGHETDFTIADFVADVRASTPSHAAEIAVAETYSLKQMIKTSENSILGAMKLLIRNESSKIDNLKNRVSIKNPQNIALQQYQYIDSITNKMTYTINQIINRNSNRYMNSLNRLEALSPFGVLKRGYAYVERENRFINSVALLNKGDNITIHMQDGSIDCQVNKVLEDELCQQKRQM